jgi:ADP-ribose pyrophosphatase
VSRSSREWERYLELRRARPALFRRATGPASIELLTDPAEVAAAEAAAGSRAASNGEALRAGVLLEDPFITVLRDPVRFAGGDLGCYLRIAASHPGDVAGVAALPVVGDRIVLVSHFRHAIGDYSLEIPRGFAEGGDPLVAMRNELEEEIGAEVTTLEELGRVWPDTGLLGTRVALYFARLSGFSQPRLAEGLAHIFVLDTAEFAQRIASNEIQDSFTLAAFARARCRGLI